jgi:hypothetical protein
MAVERNPLSLVVKEKTLGSLVTNARDIKTFVENKIKEYSVDDYQGDAKQAAKDKAELNAAAKTLNDRRITLEKEWNMPFQEFKDIITETTNMIKTASGKLDAIVKAKECEEKELKRNEITELWNAKNFNLVSLDRVFNPKWLNKTYKIETVAADIDLIINGITKDLEALENFGEDTAILKDLYLSTLNLQTTLNKGAELKANRERLAALEAEKKAAEAQKQTETNQKQTETNQKQTDFAEKKSVEAAEVKESPKVEPVKKTGTTYVFNVYGNSNEVESVKAIAEELNLCVIPSITLSGTVEEINQFKTLLQDNGLTYAKTGIINLEAKRM